MKITKLLSTTLMALIVAGSFTGCKKLASDEEVTTISKDEKSLIMAAGFNENWAEKTADGNYLIEGDILLTKAQLSDMARTTPTNNLIVANEEHYRTYELVNTGGSVRTITVSLGSGFPTHYSAALDQSLARYNSFNLNLKFQRVASGGEIHISGANLGRSFGGCILGQAAGFPSGGNPSSGFTLSTSRCATDYLNTVNKADEVMAHEIGHCIGFRHTDYINRASCGSTSGESAGTIGAVHITGTPTTVTGSYNSWMMACTNGDPTITSADVTALTTVY
ncbi:MAG TPA: M57 family metalloprotease [Segetibacter sp.]|jgi:hypothetical protein